MFPSDHTRGHRNTGVHRPRGEVDAVVLVIDHIVDGHHSSRYLSGSLTLCNKSLRTESEDTQDTRQNSNLKNPNGRDRWGRGCLHSR